MKIMFIVTYAALKNKYIFHFSCWKKQIVLNGTTMLGNSETYKQNYHRFDKDNLCED